MDAAALWRRTVAGWGEDYAERYADRFEALARRGEDVHGEARFVDALLPAGSRVLDAGCGTGRVGARLHELGHHVVGVDADDAMVEVARRRHPGPRWEVADLAALRLDERFDGAVLAGNVVPFLDEQRVAPAVLAVAAHLEPGGLVVCGFGLDAGHLPEGARHVSLDDFDDACSAAGLALQSRHDGWDGGAWIGGGYAVSVHRLPPVPSAAP